jgi:hypothetical protein
MRKIAFLGAFLIYTFIVGVMGLLIQPQPLSEHQMMVQRISGEVFLTGPTVCLTRDDLDSLSEIKTQFVVTSILNNVSAITINCRTLSDTSNIQGKSLTFIEERVIGSSLFRVERLHVGDREIYILTKQKDNVYDT